MESKKKKIAVVDDHEFFRGGLKMALKNINYVKLVIEAENGKALLEEISEQQVDIVLLDIKMPVMDGYETTKQLRENFPDVKILILSMYDNEEYLRKLLEVGVNGFVLKNIGKRDLETAINHVLNGQQYFSMELMPFFTRQLISGSNQNNNAEQLTNREQEILQLIFDGFSNKEIADKLYISIRTVTNHRANLNAKTGSKNTAGLLSYAIKNNLVG